MWLYVVVCGCMWLYVVVCGCMWLYVVFLCGFKAILCRFGVDFMVLSAGCVVVLWWKFYVFCKAVT